MIDRRTFLAAPLAVCAACRPRKSTGFPGYAFVANEEGQAVAAVDLTAFAVARYIKMPAPPATVVAHPSRPAVYVVTAHDASIHEIASDQAQLRRSVHVGGRAVAVRVAPDGASLWLLLSEPRRLVRLGVENLGVEGAIDLPHRPLSIDIAREGDRAVVGSGEAGALLLDLKELKRGAALRVGSDTESVLFRSDSRCIIAANTRENMLTLYETASGRVMTRLRLAVTPREFCTKSDGGQLFITGDGLDAVAIVYPHNVPQVDQTVLAGRAPGFMAASRPATGPDGNDVPEYLFIANPASGHVTIMDIDTRRVIGATAVGTEPSFIVITPDQQYALVLNRKSGDMAVIRIAGISPRRTKSPPPLFTMIPVGSKPVSAAVRGV